MIRPALTAWQQVTEQLIAASVHAGETERDDSIVKIDALLESREKLQPHIQAPFTEEESAFGKQLIELELQMQQQLVSFSKQIRLNISESQTKKGNINQYINPYSKMPGDGAYYDTKQ